jgi:hypothetical protein
MTEPNDTMGTNQDTKAGSKAGTPMKIDRDSGGGGPSEAAASAYFDRERGSDLASTITGVVAGAEGIPPESLEGPPLYDRIDAEHLEKALFTSGTDGSRETAVSFSYHGYRVHVRGDGYVYAVDDDS